ncbi:TM0106 family RecB-like putative nuclease [Candidatus Peregrinibacteria bacterium]|nr:TM0106 family RecB-like putative nuclease [Candidatus Peregrinibacteria bacterium]
MYVTASKLYDFIQCPHRVWRDVYGPKEEKVKETNPFVELLWEKGVLHEERIVRGLGKVVDMSTGSHEERFAATIEAMKSGAQLIYQGVLIYENLLGIPDLLRKLPDGTYIPIDIKSGMGFAGVDEEAGDEGKPKKHYAVQLCLYNELLKRLGFAIHDSGKIIDIQQEEVTYDLNSEMGPRTPMTWWEYYESIKKQVEFLINDHERNTPALCGVCKLCPWYNSCKKWWEENRDLTNIFYVGRSFRDRITEDLMIKTVDEFMELDVEDVMKQKEIEKKAGNKEFLYRIGEKSLKKAISRAHVQYKTKKPIAYEQLDFPDVSHELFFDIEDDPTQEFVYMHGVYERSPGKEQFIHFTAEELSSTAEADAWKRFWEYIQALRKDDYSIYFFSKHERTTYKRLQKQYPNIISLEEVEAFFDQTNAIDLYEIVQKCTDWPLSSYSLKALATYIGFSWRDETPSGALSIQWFNEYLKNKDAKILNRILEYNEDDCKATMIVKDYLVRLGSQS